MIPQSIMKAMEEKAENHGSVFLARDIGNAAHLGFLSGVTALYEHLKGMGGEFDVAPIEKAFHEHGPFEAWYGRKDFAAWGARFQHSLAVAREAVLVAENERLREALRFYADGNSWYRQYREDGHGYIVSRRPEDHDPKGVGHDRLAGRIAREALGAEGGK